MPPLTDKYLPFPRSCLTFSDRSSDREALVCPETTSLHWFVVGVLDVSARTCTGAKADTTDGIVGPAGRSREITAFTQSYTAFLLVGQSI